MVGSKHRKSSVEAASKPLHSTVKIQGRYPLRLHYIAKTALWAGTRLRHEFHKESEHETISETWELSVRQAETSLVQNGTARGMTLAAYIDRCGYDCVTPHFRRGDRFPLLIKLIDAADVLSVQVHPDTAYAEAVEQDSGKSELWHVLDAREGATLLYGLRSGVGKQELARAIEEHRIRDVIRDIPVRAGETYFIPAGMVHSIGSGVLLAEIQQNSDLTYRMYDFDRVSADGKPRELHLEKALAVAKAYTEVEIDALRYAKGKSQDTGELLANTEHFSVRRVAVENDREGTVLRITKESFVSVLCIHGEGAIVFAGEQYPVRRGDSYFLPADMGECRLIGDMTVLCSSCNE